MNEMGSASQLAKSSTETGESETSPVTTDETTKSASSTAQPPMLMDDRQLDLKINCIVDEFLQNTDKDETLHSLAEIKTYKFADRFILVAIDKALDKKAEVYAATCRLIKFLIDGSVFTINDVAEGLSGILQDLDNLASDIPNIYKNLVQLFKTLAISREGMDLFIGVIGKSESPDKEFSISKLLKEYEN